MTLKLINTEPERIALCADFVKKLSEELNGYFDGHNLFRFYSGGRRLRFKNQLMQDVGANTLRIKDAHPTSFADAGFGIMVQGIKKKDCAPDSHPHLKLAASIDLDTPTLFALLRFDRILGVGRGAICEEFLPLLVPPLFRLRVREFVRRYFRQNVLFYTTDWPQPTFRRAP